MFRRAFRSTFLGGLGLYMAYNLYDNYRFRKSKELIKWSDNDFIGPVEIGPNHKYLFSYMPYESPNGESYVMIGENGMYLYGQGISKELFPDGNTKVCSIWDGNSYFRVELDEEGNTLDYYHGPAFSPLSPLSIDRPPSGSINF